MKERGLFVLTIVSILILSFAAYWNFKNFKESYSDLDLPKLEMPEFNISTPQENIKKREFISADGKLKMTYTSDWIELPKESLEQLTQQATAKNSVVLFSAQKLDLEQSSFASLIVQELNLESTTTSINNPEEIIKLMKKETEEKKGEMEVINSTSTDNQTLFEAKYKQGDIVMFYSKEKIIINEKIYLISFIASYKDWPDLEQEAEKIISSVQLIE